MCFRRFARRWVEQEQTSSENHLLDLKWECKGGFSNEYSFLHSVNSNNDSIVFASLLWFPHNEQLSAAHNEPKG